uniref:Uncharacterized protein n=1 Tax=Branchiostoma floridae TaxID=7739 RepID=C3Y3G0_BRAFL|eukprot:XP_002609217.1 hypothetical protein BRAFLDRAFT_125967 [Branchiostoma floridae]
MGGKASKQKTAQVSTEKVPVRQTPRKNTRLATLAGNAGKMRRRFVKCFSKGDKNLNDTGDKQDPNTTAVCVRDAEATVDDQTVSKQRMDSKYVMMIFVMILTLSIVDCVRLARRHASFQRVEFHRRRLTRVRAVRSLRYLRLTSEMLVRLLP